MHRKHELGFPAPEREPIATIKSVGETVSSHVAHQIVAFAGLRQLDVQFWDNATSYRHTPHFNVRDLDC
eukprot:760976-Amphidinium_carterae.1